LPADTVALARYLIGKTLSHDAPEGRTSGRIVETEAYVVGDAAAHAFRGQTARNRSLFLRRGHAYVYFIYGNHYCLNVSCLPDGTPGAVLFRALEPLVGIERMAVARGALIANSKQLKLLTSGPGRMAQAFGVTRERDNGKDFFDTKSDLIIVDDGHRVRKIEATPRIGITKAADLPWRYLVHGNLFVSR